MSWGDFGNYGRTRRVKGGIQARSKRGAFGETWWGRRWMETLESFDVESRLARGRSYARSGQVLTLEIEAGEVRATVQGSQPKPYTIRIRLAVFPEAAWEKVAAGLRDEPALAARLLAGELPAEIEGVFAKAGLSLFPARSKDLDGSCSCPDWSNPCKHLAAVYCLLAEEFDRDPFLLFALRGRERDALLATLTGGEGMTAEEAPPALPPEPLPADPGAFWEGTGEPLPPLGPIRRPPVSAPIVRRLGPFPFWRGETPLAEAVAPQCDAASTRLSSDDTGES
jgi:uncharacterized Zn finger protein